MPNGTWKRELIALFLAWSSAALAQEGAVRHVHDPCIAKAGDTYYVFATGNGLPIRQSTDLIHWKAAGRVFSHMPAWTFHEVPGFRGFAWAPDISFFAGKYHLYYSVSTFGSRRSCIGLAINATLDPASKDYRWIDQGKVIESSRRDNWNAIDPNLVLDEAGTPWLAFGSFWSGIKIVRIDPATGKPAEKGIHPLAARPGEGAIEAPFIIRKDGYYYLFVSWDHCCRGVKSDYKIMVGRSRHVTGPYEDRAGVGMLQGGATLVLAGYDRYRGPGHNAVLQEGNRDWLVHHFYDAADHGIPTLQVRPLLWGDDGWPLAGEPYTKAEVQERAVGPGTVVGTWEHSVNFGPSHSIVLAADGRIDGGPASWSLAGSSLTLRWPGPRARPEAPVDRCILSADGTWYVGRNQQGDVIRGKRTTRDARGS